MQCLKEPESLELWGNEDTSSLNNIMITFVPCSNRTNEVVCQSKEKIDKWMRRKFIMILVNENEFIEYNFGEEAMQA